ncbi:MAG: 16S rRNA (cytidine(1402)-2'-O)-methyltransferase [Clostridia bacterium]|nr:16S rRNA (cytidine(1402)-2'-O)-methyltransferase [Clostridia bacterium]
MPRLYVVATPIGNLNDLSPRMREALENCDLIAAEDTRVTMKLTQVLGLHKPMVSCHRHNESQKKDAIIERMLAEDLTVALTCDAGTPGISDPGEELVRAAWEAGIPVEPVSGPSAIVTALSVSGFDTRQFAFYGFLPRENKALDEKLKQVVLAGITPAVLYESPHRVTDLLSRIALNIPGANVTVCCDLTKKFERIDRGAVGEVLNALRANHNVEKGEYCIVLDFPASEKQDEDGPTASLSTELRLAEKLLNGLSLPDACDALKGEGVKRNDIYRAKLRLTELFGAANGEDE